MAKISTINAPVGAFYGNPSITTATTRMGTTIPKGVKEIIVNCSGDWELQLAPPIILCCKTADGELTFTDYTTEATDKSTATSVTLSSLDTAANGDYFYVASKFLFAGIYVDVDAANATSSTLTGEYWAGSWTDISVTDGSDSGGATLAVDGAITWTVPANWQSMRLGDVLPPDANISLLPALAQTERLYIVRFSVSAQLDSSTTLDEVTTLADATLNPHGHFQADTDYEFNINRDETGCLDFYDSAGSKTLLITYVKDHATDQ